MNILQRRHYKRSEESSATCRRTMHDGLLQDLEDSSLRSE